MQNSPRRSLLWKRHTDFTVLNWMQFHLLLYGSYGLRCAYFEGTQKNLVLSSHTEIHPHRKKMRDTPIDIVLRCQPQYGFACSHRNQNHPVYFYGYVMYEFFCHIGWPMRINYQWRAKLSTAVTAQLRHSRTWESSVQNCTQIVHELRTLTAEADLRI
jgi:hypothetical protein